ncbi:HD superfamily phosphohydrolase [uncultured Mediterranean phage]|nr:HD superfamily phosphohydrolase [uncultured Mediterranean phage]
MQRKQIFDPIHGFINLTPLMIKIIDTPEFQRLRDLHQLGTCSYVFPSANHSRAEHSLGVSHLAKTMICSLRENQPELNISDRLIELVQIAALVHDIGHGPYSHVFDHYKLWPAMPKHEARGCHIFRTMVFEHNLDLSKDEVNMIINMVYPTHDKDWRYQIVANAINQIDVDKIDYIMRDCYHIGLTCGSDFSRIVQHCRVIGNVICFPKKICYNIFTLFATRYRLHKQIYNHPTVIAYEFIVVNILKEIVKTHKNFDDLTDSAVTCRFHNFPDQKKLFNREHKVLIGEKIFKTQEQREKYIEITPPSLQTQIYTIGFVSGNKSNPMDNVWFFSSRRPQEKFKMKKEDISFIVPNEFQESGIRWYCDRKEATQMEEKLNKLLSEIK